MSATTINYVHYTHNICIGCRHAGSPGCDHCFARDMAHRFYEPCFDDNPRHLMSDAYWKQPLAWNRKAAKEGKRFRVLCGSMCDWTEYDPLNKERNKLARIINDTPNLFWMLLTKRPDFIGLIAPPMWFENELSDKVIFPRNVALGVTVETQAQVWRIHEILQYNAPVYWVSHEPALGRIDWPPEFLALGSRALIVTGGDSGPKARPMHPDWARHDRDQCVRHRVNFWFKQWGKYVPARYMNFVTNRMEEIGCGKVKRSNTKETDRLLDGQEWNQLPEVMR